MGGGNSKSHIWHESHPAVHVGLGFLIYRCCAKSRKAKYAGTVVDCRGMFVCVGQHSLRSYLRPLRPWLQQLVPTHDVNFLANSWSHFGPICGLMRGILLLNGLMGLHSDIRAIYTHTYIICANVDKYECVFLNI